MIINEAILQESIISDFKQYIQSKNILNILKTKQKRHLEVMSHAKTVLDKNNIDTKPIGTLVKNVIKNNKSNLKQAIQSRDRKQISSAFSKAAKETAHGIRGLYTFNKNTPVNVIIALVLVAIVVFLNTALIFAFSAIGFNGLSLSGDQALTLAFALTAVFVAPLVEETAKFIAIKGKFGSEFLAVFNFFEAYSYIVRTVMAMGMDILFPIILTRLVTVVFHYSLAQIQVDYINRGKDKQGLLFAMIFHGIWNALAVMPSIIRNGL